MKLFKYDAPYVIHPFSRHSEFKEKVLGLIDTDISMFDRRLVDDGAMDIYTDYGKNDHPYRQLLESDLLDYMDQVSQFMGYDECDIDNIWYQRYYRGGKHGWHVHHDCVFTSVYYLEFPKTAPYTEFMDLTTKKVISIDSVKEGDILTFPSYIVHRAAENVGEGRKTILSWHNNVRWYE